MHPHPRPFPILLLTAAALIACGRDSRTPGGGAAGTAAKGGGPVADYSRAFFFVPGDAAGADSLPGPILIDFSSRGRVRGTHRTESVWHRVGGDWAKPLDTEWEAPAMRQPWRIVPHEPLHIVAGLDDEIEALVLRRDTATALRLEPGDFVAEWSPDPGAQVLLRDGRALAGDNRAGGWVLDARFGAVGGPDSAAAPAGTAAPYDAGFADDSALEADSAYAEGDAGDADVPVAITDVRGVLASGESTVLVLAQGPDGLVLWVWAADRQRTLTGVTLRRSPDGTTFELGRAEPAAAAAGDSATGAGGDSAAAGATPPAPQGPPLSGRLTADAGRGGRGEPVWVTGRLAVGDTRYDVRGVLRGE